MPKQKTTEQDRALDSHRTCLPLLHKEEEYKNICNVQPKACSELPTILCIWDYFFFFYHRNRVTSVLDDDVDDVDIQRNDVGLHSVVYMLNVFIIFYFFIYSYLFGTRRAVPYGIMKIIYATASRGTRKKKCF
jgi:hypothetical protein